MIQTVGKVRSMSLTFYAEGRESRGNILINKVDLCSSNN